MKNYKAHWGKSLVVMSSLFTIAWLCAAFVAFKFGGASGTSSWVEPLLLAILVSCALFTVRGYTVTPDAIRVFAETSLLGLELVPSREPIEMLVAEKAN